MRWWGLAYASIIGACVLPSSAWSQAAELRIKLNTVDGSPVNGALIALLDSRDSVVAEGLGSENGSRVLRAPPGEYRVRVRRIGYLPFISSPVSLPRPSELSLDVQSPRVVLESIVVTSKSQCRRSDPASQTLSVVWDEIDKALRASQLTIDDLAGIGQAQRYRTEFSSVGTVISADTTVFRITRGRPFGAIAPDDLAARGYVRGNENTGWQFFGPDETVLLSEQFAATHCFKLTRDRSRPRDIGVAFEPVPDRPIADIEGVLWVDQSTSELREMVFRFVNAGVLSRFEAGGFTRFRHVPSGAWIVDEWRLRAPRIELRQRQVGYGESVEYRSNGYVDTGGGIIRPASSSPDKRN